MKLINDLSPDRYFEMTPENLENEIKKYGIGDFSAEAELRKNRIEQLIAKDNAVMVKRALTISTIALIVSIFTSIVAVISLIAAIFLK